MFLSDQKPFFTLLKSTAEFYGKNMSENQLDTYWKLLKAQPFQAINSAFTAHMLCTKRGQFMPTPADIMAKSRFVEHRHGEISCQYSEGNHICGRKSIVNARGSSERDYYVCHAHWDAIRPKTDVEIEFEAKVAQFEQYARDAGMTYYEFFWDWVGRAPEKTRASVEKLLGRLKPGQI